MSSCVLKFFRLSRYFSERFEAVQQRFNLASYAPQFEMKKETASEGGGLAGHLPGKPKFRYFTYADDSDVVSVLSMFMKRPLKARSPLSFPISTRSKSTGLFWVSLLNFKMTIL